MLTEQQLHNISLEELEGLVEKKRRMEESKITPVLPPDTDINRAMIKMASEYLEQELKGIEVETQWAYEWLMTAVYGPNVFNQIFNLEG